MALADKIEQCADGDTIQVHNESMLELARSAHSSMCPNKKITFELEPTKTFEGVFLCRK